MTRICYKCGEEIKKELRDVKDPLYTELMSLSDGSPLNNEYCCRCRVKL